MIDDDLATVVELEARIVVLEEALRPFAEAAEFSSNAVGSRKVPVDQMAQMRGVSIGDCRRAREVLFGPTEPREAQ